MKGRIMKHILSLSGGKDSSAILLKSVQDSVSQCKPVPIDEVVFFDTGWEFDGIYENIKYLKGVCERYGNIPFTTLTPEIPFEDKMFNITVHKRNGLIGKGYSWCGGVCRWGTTEKLKALERYCKGDYEIVGLAHDEQHRILKERNGTKLFPLDEWKMTEAEALQYCYNHGIEFKEDAGAGEIRLYDYLDRVSCWCCGNKNLKELRNMFLHMPKYWERLKGFQNRTDRPFRRNGETIFDLEERFKREMYQRKDE